MTAPCEVPRTDIAFVGDCVNRPCPCLLALVMGCNCGYYFNQPRAEHHSPLCKKERG